MKVKQRLVYYSLYLGPASDSEKLMGLCYRSIFSLRKFNQNIPVCLVFWGQSLPKKFCDALEAMHVEIILAPPLYQKLAETLPWEWASVVEEYPVFSKWLSIGEVVKLPFEEVLYLDVDTLCTRDVEELFACQPSADIVAREEVYTERSALGIDPLHIDEPALRKIAKSEGWKEVVPFNGGVVLFRRKAADWIAINLNLLITNVARLTLGACLAPSKKGPMREENFIRKAKELGLHQRSAGIKPISFPSENEWIIEEIAFWLTIGASECKTGIFPLEKVSQGGEIENLNLEKADQLPCVFHFFSSNADKFFERWVPELKKKQLIPADL